MQFGSNNASVQHRQDLHTPNCSHSQHLAQALFLGVLTRTRKCRSRLLFHRRGQGKASLPFIHLHFQFFQNQESAPTENRHPLYSSHLLLSSRDTGASTHAHVLYGTWITAYTQTQNQSKRKQAPKLQLLWAHHYIILYFNA